MSTFSLLHPSTWNPQIRIAVALIAIAIAGVSSFIIRSELWNLQSRIVVVLVAIVIAGVSSFIIRGGLDDISKKETAIKHLEAFSLDLLRKFAEDLHGIFFNLIFYKPTDPEVIRHLINLDLIELNAFPSDKNTMIYSFTKLGRYILEKKLKRKLLSENFCEMMRVWYWQGYSEEFQKETNVFELKYKMSWTEAWEAFKPIMIKMKDPQQAETEAFAIFLIYAMGKTYDELNTNLVIPWEKETKKIKLKRWYRYIL